jgi:hypothetical protein
LNYQPFFDGFANPARRFAKRPEGPADIERARGPVQPLFEAGGKQRRSVAARLTSPYAPAGIDPTPAGQATRSRRGTAITKPRRALGENQSAP